MNNMTKLDAYGRPVIAGVTYGGIMHRFADDQAIRDYCNRYVQGGYQTHYVTYQGAVWTQDGQIGWIH